MKYKNKVTGAIIDVPGVLSGNAWEKVEPKKATPKVEPKEAEKTAQTDKKAPKTRSKKK